MPARYLRITRTFSLALLLPVLLLAAGCEREPAVEEPAAPPPVFLPVTAPVTEEVRIDLVDRFPAAQALRTLDWMGFMNLTDVDYLSSGWSDFVGERDGTGSTWVIERSAVAHIPRTSTGDYEIRLVLSAPDLRAPSPSGGSRRGLPPQTVQVRWNDRFLANLPVGRDGGIHRVLVPAEHQVIGINRLELLPRFFMEPGKDTELGKKNIPEAAVQLSSLEFPSESRTLPAGLPAARVEKDAIVQRPGSVIRYALPLPEDAELRANARLVLPEIPANTTLGGHAVVNLVDATGTVHPVAARTIAELVERPEWTFRHDLAPFAGGFVAVQFSLHVTLDGFLMPSDFSRIAMEWRPEIRGTESVLPAPERSRATPPPNVLVVLYDALRADSIAPYGSTEVRTPYLKSLADRGVVLSNAYSNSCWTLASVASMFTSLYPTGHDISQEHPLSPSLAYLPEILRQHGYATYGISENAYISPTFGFDRGFEELEELTAKDGYYNYDGPNDATRALALWEDKVEPTLEKHAESGEPFFLYLHEIDPHGPYNPPAPYDRMYAGDYRGNLDGLLISHAAQSEIEITPEEVEHLRALYRGEITFMDHLIRYILNGLEKHNLTGNTLVVFVADHGEEFMEHGQLRHSQLYDEILRVPMIFALEGALPEKQAVASDAQLLDIAPTILDILDLDIPPAMQGRSLLADLVGPATFTRPRTTHAELVNVPYNRLYATRHGDWKLIHQDRDLGPDALELYHLAADPGETVNRFVTEPIIAQALLQEMRWQRYRNKRLEAEPPERIKLDNMDPEVVQNLRNLGYVSD